MAAPFLLALFQCLYVLSSFCNLSLVSAARELAADRPRYVHEKSRTPIENSDFESPAKGLEVVHRHGPRSSQEHGRILYEEQFESSPINLVPSNPGASLLNYGSGVILPVTGGSMLNGNFVVKVGFGSEPQYLHLILDTGSAQSWIQCEPCSQCYDQQDRIFDPASSATFKNASCDLSVCRYSVNYFDGTNSSGYMARDKLTISDSDSFPEFNFGCGLINSNGFGQAAGILGLGQNSPLSLLSQTASDFANVFCYCLPKDDSSSGYLLFGLEALKKCQADKSTPILTDSEKQYQYVVNLKGITFGQQSVDTSTTKTIIDSGTVRTHLPPSVYDAVLSQFQESMAKLGAVKSTQPDCYDLGGGSSPEVPTMVLQFDQMDLDLDSSAIVSTEGDSVCLAFIRNREESEQTIIGNYQHRSINLLYDVANQKLEFGAFGDCP